MITTTCPVCGIQRHDSSINTRFTCKKCKSILSTDNFGIVSVIKEVNKPNEK